MPSLMRAIGLYANADTQRAWSITNWLWEDDTNEVYNAFDSWNTSYLEVCSSFVVLRGLQVYLKGSSGHTILFPTADFATTAGQIAQDPIPDANGLLWQGYGDEVTKGRSDWLLHGVAETLIPDGNRVNLTDAGIMALDAASGLYFQQYRPDGPTARGYPSVTVPQQFDSWRINPMVYLQRVGRGFVLPGQTRQNRR